MSTRRVPKTLSLVAICLAISAAASSTAFAQATRTWVSGVGDDANPCSRTAPCKTFAGAISKTAAKGEINAIDPAGYGQVTITKSITIDGTGTMASILSAGVNGVIINAGANDVVILRNLSINGAGTGINGVRFIAGGALHLENVTITGFVGTPPNAGNGIDFNPSGASTLYISNVTIRNNAGPGVLIRPVGSGSAIATITRTLLEDNGGGVFQSDGALTSVYDSVATGNAGAGFHVQASSVSSKLQLDRSSSTGNTGYGVRTDGAAAVIRLSASTIVQNGVGMLANGGIIMTFQNNTIAGNPGGDGTPTSTAPLK